MNDVPIMTDAEREAFEKAVARLLEARWNTGKIADWAVSGASGFGRFWRSHRHALDVINKQCREMNAIRRAAHRNVRTIFRKAGF